MSDDFHMAAKTIQWGKDSLFNKAYGETEYPHAKRMKMDPHLTPYIKVNSKCIKGLNA